MTVQVITNFVNALGNDILTQFTFNFHCYDTAWIRATLDDVETTLFTVALNADQQTQPGGTVTFTTAPGAGVSVVIFRDAEMTQGTDYNPYGPFPANSHEAALDKLTLGVQDAKESAERSLKYPIGSDPDTWVKELPLYSAGLYWRWSNTEPGVIENADPLEQSEADARYVQLTQVGAPGGVAAFVHAHVKSDITDFAHTHPTADISDRDLPYGVAVLDGNGRIQMDDMPINAFTFMGNWDASGGTLPSTPSDGDLWQITVAGTVDVVPIGGTVPTPTFLIAGSLIAYTSSTGYWYVIALNPGQYLRDRSIQFVSHETSPPSMAVGVGPGKIYRENFPSSLLTFADRATSTITAPTTNNRIDRIAMNFSGTLRIIAGTESVTPTAPSYEYDDIPIAQVLLTPGMTEIVNADITDEFAGVFKKDTISGLPLANRNLIINGDFQIWQRAIAAATKNVYTADRWHLAGTAPFTVSWGRSNFYSPIVPPTPRYAFGISWTSSSPGASDYLLLVQRIRDVTLLSNEKCTIQIEVENSVGIALELVQNFGTGGSATVLTPIGQILSSSGTYSITFTVPDITGKILGSNNDDHLAIQIWLSAGSDYNARTGSLGHRTPFSTLYLRNIQLERGSVATEFERLPFDTVLKQCQRYYQKSYNYAVIAGTITTTGMASAMANGLVFLNTLHDSFVSFMHSIPVMTWYSPATGTAARIRDDTAGADVTVVGTVVNSERKTGYVQVSAAPALNSLVSAHWTAEAEIL